MRHYIVTYSVNASLVSPVFSFRAKDDAEAQAVFDKIVERDRMLLVCLIQVGTDQRAPAVGHG